MPPATQPSAIPEIFDRTQVKNSRNHAAHTLDQYRFLIDRAAHDIADRLTDINRTFPRALQIGARTTYPQETLLCQNGSIEELIKMDLADGLSPDIVADEELLPFTDNSFDLVISLMTLHSVNDVPGALTHIHRVLKPDGLFLAVLPGGDTLHELRHVMMEAELALKGGVSPRIAPFADKKQMGGLLQRTGFALPVVDSDTITVTYEHVFKLLQDLRGMGESNIVASTNKKYIGKAVITETARRYQEQFAEPDGRIPATVEMIFLTGWTPHESQQQPMRPGSAEHSLTEALQKKPASNT